MDTDESMSDGWEEIDERVISIQFKSNLTNIEIDRTTIPLGKDVKPDEKFLANHIEKEKKYGKYAVTKNPNEDLTEDKLIPHDTIERGRLKIIGLESKTPMVQVDETLYLAEEIPAAKSIVIFPDETQGHKNVITQPKVVSNQFRCEMVSVKKKVVGDDDQKSAKIQKIL